MRRVATLVLAFALAGCQRADDAVATVPDAPVAEASSSPSSVGALPVVALDMGGLRLIDPASGKATPLAFGMPRDTVQAAVARSLGRTPELSSLGECPAGPMDFARFGALTLNFAEGAFAGWSLRDGEPTLTTMDGIGIGTTRTQVEAARSIEMLGDSTLGAEFLVAAEPERQSLSGIFDGEGDSARVETLWSGVACNFR